MKAGSAALWIAGTLVAIGMIGYAAYYADQPAYHADAHEFSQPVYPAIGSVLVVQSPFVASVAKEDLEYVTVPMALRDPQCVESMILTGDAIRVGAGERIELLEIAEYAKPIEAARIRTKAGECWTIAAVIDSPWQCKPVDQAAATVTP